MMENSANPKEESENQAQDIIQSGTAAINIPPAEQLMPAYTAQTEQPPQTSPEQPPQTSPEQPNQDNLQNQAPQSINDQQKIKIDFNQPPPENGHKHKKALKISLVIIGVVFFLVFLVVSAGFAYLLPRLRIGRAFANSLALESMQTTIQIDDFDQKVKKIKMEGNYDKDRNGNAEISISKLRSENDPEFMTIELRKYDDNFYYRISHNKMTQLYNQLLTNWPLLNGTESLDIIKPVLFGDYWFKDSEISDSAAEEREEVPKFATSFTIALASLPLKIESIEKEEVDGIEIDVYKLHPQEDMDWTFTKTYSSETPLELNQTDEKLIAEEDVAKIIQILGQTENISEAELIIKIGKRDKLIKEISLSVPHLAGEVKEVDFEQVLLREMTPTGFIIQKTINKTRNSDTKITELFKANFEKNPQEFTIDQPEKIVDLNEVDEEVENIAMILVGSFLTDANLLEQSYDPNNLFSTKTHETKLLFNQGNYDEMLSSAEELLTLFTNDEEKAIAHYWLGLAHYNLDNLDAAADALLEAIKLNPTVGGPYVTLAAIAYAQSDFNTGLQYSLKCKELSPGNAWCYNNIGIGYMYLGDASKGIEYMEKAVEMDPVSFVFAENLKRARSSSQGGFSTPSAQTQIQTQTQNPSPSSSQSSSSGFESFGQKEVEPGIKATINDAREVGGKFEIDVTFANVSTARSTALSPIRLSMYSSDNLGTGIENQQILQLPLEPGTIRSFTFIYSGDMKKPVTWKYASSSGANVELGTYR